MTDSKKSYFHRGGTDALLGDTIPEHFKKVVRQFPDAEAVVSIPQNQILTYSQLDNAIDTLARGLVGIGFNKGDRVGIWSTNNVEWLLLQLATARIGVILVNINPANRSRELGYALQRSELKGLFTIPEFRTSNYISMLTELIPELKTQAPGQIKNSNFPGLRQVVVYDPEKPLGTERPHSGFLTWRDLTESSDKASIEQLNNIITTLDRDDPINIQFTSGTTGFPKAVLLTHHNILNNAYFSARAMNFTNSDRLVVPVPFYHCFGMVLANLLCLSVGACIVIPGAHFDELEVLEAVQNEKCTAIHGVPTMFIAELEHPKFADFDLSTLRTGIMAGAPCPPLLMKRVMEDMHCREILIGYGQTEASPITHLTLINDNPELRTTTVGKNLPHQEVKIVDMNTGLTLPLGHVGEVCFRGYNVMLGYYGDEPATRKAKDEHGWLHSGDLGRMDEEGYLHITGRLSDMIIRGGENIYPREIEDYIFTHPKVAAVAVFGVPDDYYGEEAMAWIQLHPGEEATEDEIRTFCKGKIAHFKIPKYIWFVEEFPMTVTGKLKKYRMKEISLEKLQRNNNV